MPNLNNQNLDSYIMFMVDKNVSPMNSFKVTIFVKTIFFITLLAELVPLLLVDTTQLN